MKIAIMQPYFMPYIGYFQLMNAVDKFVVYDNIQYTKKGWINRNRILVNGKDEYITLPVKKDSDYLNIDKRVLADSFVEEKGKIIRKIKASYGKAPQFDHVFPILEGVISFDSKNLFEYIYNSLNTLRSYLDIQTEFIISSTVPIDHSLKSQDKVIAICKNLDAKYYINPIGGLDLYSKEEFQKNNIELSFIKAKEIRYPQFNNEFIPWLSILDVLMFNGKEDTKKMLTSHILN